MTHTVLSQHKEILDHVRQDLSGLEISGSDISMLIRVPLYFAVKNTDSITRIRRYLFFVRQLLTLANLLGSRIISRLLAKRLSKITGEILFVIDHSPAKDIEFQSLIWKYFDKSKLQILTVNPLVQAQLGPLYSAQIYRSDCMANRVQLTNKDYLFCLRALFRAKRVGLSSLPFLAVCIMRSILHIRLYEQVLSSAKTKAVVTLCDAHPHEHAITGVATRKGISTYTNQHGMIGSLYAPVISNKIFVWGDVSKDELIRLGVDQEKIIVAGRVGLAPVPQGTEIRQTTLRTQFSIRHKFDPTKLSIAYFATNWGGHENIELFKVFCSILSLPINILVRPRPGASNQQITEYRKWLLSVSEASVANVVISNEDPMQEVFYGVDAVVTCHSGCIVDAMPYSVIGVILDLFKYMDLRDTLPYYQDAIVCHDSASFFSIVQNLVKDNSFLTQQKRQAFHAYKKYFANPQDKPVERVIADYIISAHPW